jgi:hypothetical protein
MDTVHSFRSIRVRTVYLISLFSIGGPLRARWTSDRQVEAACIIPFAFAWTYEGAELYPLILAIRRPFRVGWNATPDSYRGHHVQTTFGVTRVVLELVILRHCHDPA